MNKNLPKLSDRAMLASLKISAWSARKLDRKITDETNRLHNASADAGRYNKALLAKDALGELVKLASNARTTHYSLTLPWLDDGGRILTVAGYETYTAQMAALREQWESAVKSFVDSYPSFVADARVRLNGMFNESDYPTVREVARKFDLRVRMLPVPEADDFRASVGDSQSQFIKSEIEKATREAINDAMKDVWQRVADVVSAMAEKLKAYQPDKGREGGVFRDSLVQNIRDLVGILPMLNLTGDPKLTAMCGKLEKELCRYDADALREDDALRNEIADKAAAIFADVSGFMA